MALRFRAQQTKVQDLQRKFHQAGTSWYRLSMTKEDVDDQQKVNLLEKASICVVLAPESAAKQRLLKMVANDERIGIMDRDVYEMLITVSVGKLISNALREKFRSKLEPHHLAVTSTSNVYDEAVLQHNLLSLSRC